MEVLEADSVPAALNQHSSCAASNLQAGTKSAMMATRAEQRCAQSQSSMWIHFVDKTISPRLGPWLDSALAFSSVNFTHF